MGDKRENQRGRDAELPIYPSAIPSGEQTVWTDISPLLQHACEDLRDGELILGENFNYLAAMSALEIMDPKMDSGMVRTYYSVDEAIDYGVAPVPLSVNRTIDVRCIIDIMDHLLACEATWHKGQSLAQTVFSCIYLLRPDRTSSYPLLHSYCQVTRATCDAVVSTVSEARTNEEEDLFTMTHGLPLKVDGDDKCLTMLNVVDETVSRQLRACKATLIKKRALEDMEPLQTNLDLEEGFCKAVLCRLRFRKHFYHVLTNMKRPQGRGFDLAKKHIASCLQEIDSMLKTEKFLSQNNACALIDDSKEDKTTASGCAPIGFDSTLNSRLSAPAPPRSIKILCWKKAIDYFRKLLHELDYICSNNLDPMFESVLNFVVEFQKLQPELVARAHLQRLLIQDGKLYGRDPLFAVICNAALLPTSAKGHAIQNIEPFTQLGQLLITLLRILCTNLAWQRRKLGKILQDWRIIYVQIELAFRKEFGETCSDMSDENMCAKIFKHILVWIEEQTYRIAYRFLLLGFDLELYSTSEFCMVYWYINVILVKLAEKTYAKLMASNKNVKRKGKKRDLMKNGARYHPLPPVVLFLQCQLNIVEGLTMMLAALRNEIKIYQNVGPFNTEHERFMQHFELLQKACLPDHISYCSFKEATDHARISTRAMHNFFKDAQRLSKELRSSFSNDPIKMAELKSIEHVAEHNNVAMNLIGRLGTLDSSLKVYFQFNHHPYFTTAIVKRS
ncbi:unnamed protein product [Cuscuta campestris]|uniref:N-alpha-acetyltransferase 35, NatC auxiliary subunit n=1 Tax=Cuscuta campestris TaxID=132261 RepID=A0A484M3K4_9ASTE|nr:unnamed protein product [Cuscuta campestris]